MPNLTPLRAIRAKCIDCSGGNRAEVRECPVVKCPLYKFRNGTNPNRKGIGNQNPDRTALTRKSGVEFGVLSENEASESGVMA